MDALLEIQQKYAFGFEDYMEAMKMLDPALENNQLEQFLEDKNERRYDWLTD